MAEPVLEYTVNAGTGIYTLNWNAITGATNYFIWQSTSTIFQTDPTYQSGGAISLVLPALHPTRYYFYVVATNGTMNSLPSNILQMNALYELEDNDSGATANGPLLSGLVYHGNTDDLKDYYKFYVDAPAAITITFSEPAGWNGQIQLFYNDLLQRKAYDVHTPYQIVYTLLPSESGWYYFYVATLAEDINPNLSYTFTITY